MDDDDSILGLTIEIIAGAIVIGLEVGFWVVGALCMIPVIIFEIFFGDD